MSRLAIALALGLLAGLGVARWLYVTPAAVTPAPRAEARAADAGATGPAFDPAAPVAERLAALEQAVAIEREARQLLEEEIVFLTGEVERLRGGPPGAAPALAPTDAAATAAVETRRLRSRRIEDTEAWRRDRLVDAGFSPDEAARILKRESELQMDALHARYAAELAGEELGFFESRNATGRALREELGDQAYERYLEANGRSTRVAIASVLESSPAQAAGLRAGDEIVSYDGQRVFGMFDLTEATKQGEPGENVVVDIVRDGMPMQVVMPRGPLGISGGRRRQN